MPHLSKATNLSDGLCHQLITYGAINTSNFTLYDLKSYTVSGGWKLHQYVRWACVLSV